MPRGPTAAKDRRIAPAFRIGLGNQIQIRNKLVGIGVPLSPVCPHLRTYIDVHIGR